MLFDNRDILTGHGDREGRDLALQILEGGMSEADPYMNTHKLIRLEGDRLVVGGYPEMDVSGYGEEVVDLREIENIYVLGAGKAVQRQAKAVEDLLGDRLTAGAITIKHGEKGILERIEVSYGAHPVPDQGSLDGTKKLIDIADRVTERDLVITVFSDGASSLTPLPMPGVTLDDLHTLYRLAQKYGEQGVIIRNMAYFSQASRGRLMRRIHPARSINLIMQVGPYARWHGVVPDQPSFAPSWPPGATRMADDVPGLQAEPWYDELPAHMRDVYERLDPAYDVPDLAEFRKVQASYYQPIDQYTMMRGCKAKAEELGIKGVWLASFLMAYSAPAAEVIAAIARDCDEFNQPFETPCALITSGHLNVPTGDTTGVGGRNQEFALKFAQLLHSNRTASKNVVVAAMDSDGTDGPGMTRADGSYYCAAGAVIDGQTVLEAEERGVDIAAELANHNATPALLALDSAIHTGNTGTCLGDIRVVLVR